MGRRKTINQLDLFSGIGGFHLGFERAGYKVNSYFSEIDKHAIAVYKQQFKNSKYVGSVVDIRGNELPRIDLITFGSPCQDFSLAGKREGMSGERSSLILEAIRLISECRPRVFIWENVKGTFSSNSGEDFAAILQAFANIGGYRLEWQLLNTSWFLPQNRERIYLVGYSTKTKRNWRGVFPIGEGSRENTNLPRQQGNTCTLTTRYGADGNGSYVTERKQYAQEIRITDKRGNEREATKASTLVAGYHKLPSDADYIKVKSATFEEIGDYRSDEGWRPRKDNNCPTLAARAREDGSGQPLLKVKSATSKGYEEATEGDSINLSQPNSETRRGRVGKGKAQTLETSCNQAVVQPVQIGQSSKTFAAKSGTLIGKEGQDAFTIRSSNPNGVKVVEPKIIGYTRDAKGKVTDRHLKDEAGTIHSSSGGGGNTDQFVQEQPMIAAQRGRYQEDGTIKQELEINKEGKSNTLTAVQKDNMVVEPNYRIRRLTPIECERLQGFPDNHTEYGNYDGEVKKMSNTQRYKQCGNAVTVDVVQAIAEKIKPLL
jgi:DNA (cytosine-5)-methyltransferase 1